MTIIQEIETLENHYQEKEKQIETVEDQWDQAFENWQKKLISGEKMDQLENMFRNQISSLREECGILYNKLTELKQAAKDQAVIKSIEMETYINTLWQKVSDQDDFMDGQEPQHQTVEVITVETIIRVRQQPQSLQQQQQSSDSSIKMVDIYEQQTQFEQSVFSEIEGQNVEQIAAYEMSYDTLDLEQMHANSVKKFDTFRGGTEFIYNPSPIIFSESDDKTMETIMFGAQTAKQFQINGQKYQEDMKDNPNSGVKRKTQKFQIEEDKVIEAYVTHWQELENYIRVQQWQELEHAKLTGGEDHNFRHGAEKQPCHNNYTISSNSTNSV